LDYNINTGHITISNCWGLIPRYRKKKEKPVAEPDWKTIHLKYESAFAADLNKAKRER
jgi:hypothetical protein